MCGIAGLWAMAAGLPVSAELARAMADAIAHRGPDGHGVASGPGWALAHRRLSIVDIAGGSQPMHSGDGALCIVFNGEIYNHEVLRAELEALGCVFRTRSDTEVLLHGYRHWGTGLPSRLRGMFAFAIVEPARRRLFAARDRLGKKPFYWTVRNGQFAFASEPKALHRAGLLPQQLRVDALAQFLCLRYVPDPNTIWPDVHRLPAAHWLLIDGPDLRQQCYWQLDLSQQEAPRADLGERLLALLDDCVKVRLMGEVPLAPFLSGGIDSYAVTDSMARQTGAGLRACTIGFREAAFDERPAAREAAAACGVQLIEEELRSTDLTQLDWFADTFDEPFADSSAVPTYHVSRLARRHVTVALSGDGGDESFAGYRRHLFDVRENRWRHAAPRWLWRAFGALYPKADFLPRPLRWRRTLQNLGRTPAEAYARSVSATLPEELWQWLRPEYRAAAGAPLQPLIDAHERAAAPPGDALARAAATDFATWLPGDILVKVDRASMATALEVRAPFLDHHMVEFAARIPSAVKLAGGRTKALLRDVLAKRLLPRALQRPKQGFSVPLRDWLRGAVGAALETMLPEARLREWIDPAAVHSLLAQHRGGLRDRSEPLWALLVFERFLRRWCA